MTIWKSNRQRIIQALPKNSSLVFKLGTKRGPRKFQVASTLQRSSLSHTKTLIKTSIVSKCCSNSHIAVQQGKSWWRSAQKQSGTTSKTVVIATLTLVTKGARRPQPIKWWESSRHGASRCHLFPTRLLSWPMTAKRSSKTYRTCRLSCLLLICLLQQLVMVSMNLRLLMLQAGFLPKLHRTILFRLVWSKLSNSVSIFRAKRLT